MAYDSSISCSAQHWNKVLLNGPPSCAQYDAEGGEDCQKGICGQLTFGDHMALNVGEPDISFTNADLYGRHPGHKRLDVSP